MSAELPTAVSATKRRWSERNRCAMPLMWLIQTGLIVLLLLPAGSCRKASERRTSTEEWYIPENIPVLSTNQAELLNGADQNPPPIPVDVPIDAPTPIQTVSPDGVDQNKPSTPTNVHAELGWGARTRTWSWSPSTDDVGVVGYRLYSYGKLIASVKESPFVEPLGKMAPPEQRVYTVIAYDAAGNESEPSKPATLSQKGGAQRN